MRFFEFQRNARGETRKLLLVFALTVLLLVLAVNAALALAWGLTWSFWFPGAGFPRHFFAVNTAVVLLYVLGGWWVETSRLASGGGQRLAEQMGARLAQPSGNFDEQRFCNIVDEMAISSGMKRPTAMVVARDQGINAFATGWDEDDAVVAVTRGALEFLTREELQGLVAHEFSHIREGDTRLNMRLIGMVFGLEMLYRMGQHLFEPDVRGRRMAAALLGLAIMAAGWLGWVAGHALQAAVSRQREYLADARAVQWTRSRDGIGGVLRKVKSQRQADFEPRQVGSTVQHMLLVGNEAGQVAHWLDSHPTLEQRIRRIYGRHMEALPLERDHALDATTTAQAAPTDPSGPQAPGWTLS
ncbi:M48 family metalloprotease [Hydrogenophaga sp.]|uniref:M48 family metalloprotease n=1 Tax=Hydrogenophaga sp. TaxID=1904254 RepID=UPI002720595E|nr:M48 family metalloprotease [Hydrogenophaga sp.]MDZ4358056.1 M48 family metalloprotease [Variovorax sp.]MDO9250515.1 M48 family metalloprotease [Hydrogenophaga sp.]MDP3324149.1 M48 family metalloprotease [Hydrogenophaga sp.]MDP3887711.1 M48 family metalloprotease [Hydrogenophaga sp.]MDZ4173934.1 M48 family metalloprotease [Hydrogenophaga sp.]